VRDPSFPLRVGAVTHRPTFGDPVLPNVTSYEIEADRRYKVLIYAPDLREEAGTCEVSRGPNGNLVVSPDFLIKFPYENCTFYGSFTADEAGRAVLEEVVLVVTDA